MSQVLMMECVVNRDRDLSADLLEEFYVCFAVGLLLQAGKSHSSQPSQRRGQRHHAEGIDAVLLHPLGELQPAKLFGDIRYDDRLLRLPDYSGWSLFNRLFMATHDVGRNIRLKSMEPHHVAHRIV